MWNRMGLLNQILVGAIVAVFIPFVFRLIDFRAFVILILILVFALLLSTAIRHITLKQKVQDRIDMGFYLIERKEAHAAMAEFRKALSTHPDHWMAHLGKGRAHRLLGEVDEAMEELKIVLKLNPGSTEAKTIVGHLLIEKARYFESIRNFKNAALAYNQALKCPMDKKEAHAVRLALDKLKGQG